jgi:hypothetical protein
MCLHLQAMLFYEHNAALSASREGNGFLQASKMALYLALPDAIAHALVALLIYCRLRLGSSAHFGHVRTTRSTSCSWPVAVFEHQRWPTLVTDQNS